MTRGTSRAAFLERVREATGRSIHAPVARPPLAPRPSEPREVGEMAERFKGELEKVHGRAHLVASLEEGRSVLAQLLVGRPSLVRSTHPILDALGLSELGLTEAAADEAEVGVTGCELAVAATGSVALSSSWGRLAALLPPRHVVVVEGSQLVFDLNDLYLALAARDLPGAWGMHSGPSKSADIEQTMALGVHGPGSVDAIVVLGGDGARGLS